ncbi:MAG: acyl-CoA thioesterase [Acidimicrobiales bacterium]
MAGTTDDLTAVLDLERIDRDLFRGPDPGEREGRLFGGQVASQALRAAGATVEAEHQVNSLHAYFLRPGRFGTPVVFTVDRIRDGSSFTTRRVVATQHGEAVLNLDASFHVDEDGGVFQPQSPLAEVPDPDSVAPDRSRRGSHHRHLDSRPVEVPGDSDEARSRWVRIVDPMPDDPLVHACAITFLSDTGPLGAARRAIGGPEGDAWRESMMTASLDHCIWFHQPARADDWLFYRLEPVVVGRARGLSRGQIWTRDGVLAATVTQEALLRWRR